MEQRVELQWFPGHMAKATRELQALWRLVDVVLEVADARVPSTSRHPDPVGPKVHRPRVLLLGKADLASPEATEAWVQHYRRQGLSVWAADLRRRDWVRPVVGMLERAGRTGRGRGKAGGVRALVAGLPNVGKSTAINSLAGRAKAATGGRPGVTRSLQWLAAGRRLQLLDSPGVLWPHATRGLPALLLAATGCVPDTVFDVVEAAEALLGYLLQQFPGNVHERYGPDPWPAPGARLPEVAQRRGMLRAAGEPDLERAAAAVLHDFRTGRLGRLTLEMPDDRAESAVGADGEGEA